jgi:hypothetical protein
MVNLSSEVSDSKSVDLVNLIILDRVTNTKDVLIISGESFVPLGEPFPPNERNLAIFALYFDKK